MTKTRIYAVLLAGAICISLAGCGNTAPVSELETVQMKAEETADDTSGIDISDVIAAEPTMPEESEPLAESSASEPQQPAEKEKSEPEPAPEQTKLPVQMEPQKPAEPTEPQQPQEPPAAQTQRHPNRSLLRLSRANPQNQHRRNRNQRRLRKRLKKQSRKPPMIMNSTSKR